MFDNDQVLCYMWSATLPIGTVFQCPQPRWKDRETHLVMHSGAAELGQWLNEERHLLADYARLKQGPLPKAIKQVWFIAGSAQQGPPGAISFRDVSLGDKQDDRRFIFSQRGLSRLDRNIAAIAAIGYTAISKDKLDYANWGPRGLTLTYYQGDGKFLLQQWPYEGEPSTVEDQVMAVTPPDAAGNWSSDELVSVKDAKGDLQQWHQVWSLKNGELSVVKDKPQPGAQAASPWVRGTHVRKMSGK